MANMDPVIIFKRKVPTLIVTAIVLLIAIAKSLLGWI